MFAFIIYIKNDILQYLVLPNKHVIQLYTYSKRILEFNSKLSF